jgi:LuxR family maltose regulon positive regulatory protein
MSAFLLPGELSNADNYLKRFEFILDNTHFHGYAVYHHFAGLYNLLSGKRSRALSHAETVVKLSDETGYALATIVCRIQLAYILHEQEKSQEALKELSHAHSKAHETKSSIYMFRYLMVSTKIAFDQGKDKKGIEFLRKALFLGRKHNYLNMIWWCQPTIVSQLCERALMEGIEEEYVKKLIRAHKLVPESPPYHIEHWPWTVKIYTFDRFQIVIDGKSLQFTGKAQKRPLELLKTIFAYGGVDIRIDKIIDALWY